MDELERLAKLNELSATIIELLKIKLYICERIKSIEDEINKLKGEE